MGKRQYSPLPTPHLTISGRCRRRQRARSRRAVVAVGPAPEICGRLWFYRFRRAESSRFWRPFSEDCLLTAVLSLSTSGLVAAGRRRRVIRWVMSLRVAPFSSEYHGRGLRHIGFALRPRELCRAAPNRRSYRDDLCSPRLAIFERPVVRLRRGGWRGAVFAHAPMRLTDRANRDPACAGENLCGRTGPFSFTCRYFRRLISLSDLL